VSRMTIRLGALDEALAGIAVAMTLAPAIPRFTEASKLCFLGYCSRGRLSGAAFFIAAECLAGVTAAVSGLCTAFYRYWPELAAGAGRSTGPSVIFICQGEQALFGEGIGFVGDRTDNQSPISEVLVVHIRAKFRKT
jgi:hypothetical protein